MPSTFESPRFWATPADKVKEQAGRNFNATISKTTPSAIVLIPYKDSSNGVVQLLDEHGAPVNSVREAHLIQVAFDSAGEGWAPYGRSTEGWRYSGTLDAMNVSENDCDGGVILFVFDNLNVKTSPLSALGLYLPPNGPPAPSPPVRAPERNDVIGAIERLSSELLHQARLPWR